MTTSRLLADGAVVVRIMKVHAAAGRYAVDVDARLLGTTRIAHADAVLRGDARGRDG